MEKTTINNSFLEDKILSLLESKGFLRDDVGTICYMEIIKCAICKLIEFSGKKDETNQYGSLLSSMCLFSSEFYQEVYENIINNTSLNISNFTELHLHVKNALPKGSKEFTSDTYMFKANALAYNIFGTINKSNGLIGNNIKHGDESVDYIDVRIMSILGAYGFDKNDLGTFCYMEVIKRVVKCLNLRIDGCIALDDILKNETTNLYSYFYINVWSEIASTKKIKKLELEKANQGFEFNFAYMQLVIKNAIYNSDLALELVDKEYTSVLSKNINEIATKVVNDINELQNDKSNRFGKVRK